MNIFDLLRSCAHCHVNWRETDLFCEHCWKRFDSLILQESEVQENVHALFEWPMEKEHPVGELLYLLKGGFLKSAFGRLARYWIHRQNFESLEGCPVFVPAPPRIAGQEDHAHLWGKSLAKAFGLELVQALRRVSSEEQKTLSLEERKKKKLLLDIENDYENVIFVDDVLTSGSTATAAYEALGKPERFQVWVIGYRPKILKTYMSSSVLYKNGQNKKSEVSYK